MANHRLATFFISRLQFYKSQAVFHRPHPEKVTDKGAVKAMRQFLNNAGVKL